MVIICLLLSPIGKRYEEYHLSSFDVLVLMGAWALDVAIIIALMNALL